MRRHAPAAPPSWAGSRSALWLANAFATGDTKSATSIHTAAAEVRYCSANAAGAEVELRMPTDSDDGSAPTVDTQSCTPAEALPLEADGKLVKASARLNTSPVP